MRIAALASLLLAGVSLAGHTRPGYVDGCRSADGAFLDPARQPDDRAKVPVRPSVKRGDAMKDYAPSLDPVRVAGTAVAPAEKQP